MDSLEDDAGPVCANCRSCYCEECYPSDKPFCTCPQEDIAVAIMHLHLQDWLPKSDSMWTREGTPPLAACLVTAGLPTDNELGLQCVPIFKEIPSLLRDEEHTDAATFATEGEAERIPEDAFTIDPIEFWEE